MRHLREFEEFDASEFDDMFDLGFTSMWSKCNVRVIYDDVQDYGLVSELTRSNGNIKDFPDSVTSIARKMFTGKFFGDRIPIKRMQSKLVEVFFSVTSLEITATANRDKTGAIDKIKKEGLTKDFVKVLNEELDTEVKITGFSVSLTFEEHVDPDADSIFIEISPEDGQAFQDLLKVYDPALVEKLKTNLGIPNEVKLEFFDSKGEKMSSEQMLG
jgi:hypothetical protein